MPMTYTMRPTTTADQDAVTALLRKTYPELLAPDYSPEVLSVALPIITQARPELLNCGTYYVAETPAGTIIGAGGWTLDPDNTTLGHIRHVVSDLDYLRLGVGKAIMTRSYTDAKAQGVTTMECWATLTAVPFYQAVGFEYTNAITVPLQGNVPFPAVRMIRTL